MLYSSKARRTHAGSGASAPTSARVSAPGGGEPLNRLLRRSVLSSTPTVEFEDSLQLAMDQKGKCGLCGMFAWVAQPANETDPIRILWWKYKQDAQPFQHVPASGKVLLQQTRDIESIRTVLFYEAVSRQEDAGRVPSVAVADESGLSIHRLQNTPDGTTALAQFLDWKNMGVAAGAGGALCVLHHGFLAGCNTAGCLYLVKDDGRANPLSLTSQVFEDRSLYQRLWGVTRQWLQGGASAGSQVRGILPCKTASMVAGRGSGARADEQLDVMVLTSDEVHKWRLTALRGDSTASVLCSAQRTALGASQLLDMKTEGACVSSGKWADACLHVLAHTDGVAFSLHTLQLEDLHPRQPAVELPPLDPTDGVESARLLGATVNMSAGHVINTHVTDGRQLLTLRCPLPGSEPEPRATSWQMGPPGPLCGSEINMEERRRQSELLLLLLPATVHAIHPVQHDPQVSAQAEDHGLLQILTASHHHGPGEVLHALKDSKLGSDVLQMHKKGANDVSGEWLLLESLRAVVVDRTMDLANSGSDKGAYERHVGDKEQHFFQTYQAAIAAKFGSSPGLLEDVARYGDRLKAARRLFGMPSLFPGRSILSDGIERIVDLWEGQNELRPWAVAWKAFSEQSSRVEEVLTGVKGRLKELPAGDSMRGSEQVVLQALLDAGSICERLLAPLLDDERERGEGGGDVSHMINVNSLTELGEVIELVMTTCVDLKRTWGQNQNALLENTLVRLQGMHVRLLCWAPRLGVEERLVQDELDAKAAQYLHVWEQGGDMLARLDFRIQLAEELQDVQTLVKISVHEIEDEDEQRAKNDEWAVRFSALNYATHLLDYLKHRDVRLLWEPPFATYDYTAELSSYVDSQDNQNLAWVMRLRREGQLETMVQRLESNGIGAPDELISALGMVQNLPAKEQNFAGAAEQMLNMSRRAPHPRGALALLSLAKLAGEAAQRKAGTLWDAEQVQAGVVNAQVQLREGGVRVTDPEGLWMIERAARECIEKVKAAREGDVQMPAGAVVEERRRLLREGMLLLGYWPQGAHQEQPSDEWQKLFWLVVEEAKQLALAGEDGFDRQLVQEALQGAGPVRMGGQCRWPQHTVQFRFLEGKSK